MIPIPEDVINTAFAAGQVVLYIGLVVPLAEDDPARQQIMADIPAEYLLPGASVWGYQSTPAPIGPHEMNLTAWIAGQLLQRVFAYPLVQRAAHAAREEQVVAQHSNVAAMEAWYRTQGDAK